MQARVMGSLTRQGAAGGRAGGRAGAEAGRARGAAQAVRLTLVQLLINSKGLQMNPLQSLYYISPACLLCLTPPLGAPASSAWFACTSRQPGCLLTYSCFVHMPMMKSCLAHQVNLCQPCKVGTSPGPFL